MKFLLPKCHAPLLEGDDIVYSPIEISGINNRGYKGNIMNLGIHINRNSKKIVVKQAIAILKKNLFQRAG